MRAGVCPSRALCQKIGNVTQNAQKEAKKHKNYFSCAFL